VIVVLSALAFQPALVYVPATRSLLGLESIPPLAWATTSGG